MFAIQAREVTQEILDAAPAWTFYGDDWRETNTKDKFRVGRKWNQLGRNVKLSYGQAYPDDTMCYPCVLIKDGWTTRIECPRMPDEAVIEELSAEKVIHRPGLDFLGSWIFYIEAPVFSSKQSVVLFAPTPEHYPRLTCDGVWVWTTRR